MSSPPTGYENVGTRKTKLRTNRTVFIIARRIDTYDTYGTNTLYCVQRKQTPVDTSCQQGTDCKKINAEFQLSGHNLHNPRGLKDINNNNNNEEKHFILRANETDTS